MKNIVATEIVSIEQMPGFTNLSGFSSFIGYLETNTGKKYLAKYEKAAAQKKKQRWIAGAVAITIIILLSCYGEKLLSKILLSLVTVSFASIFTYFIAGSEKKARRNYFNERRKYGLRIANFVSSLLKAKYHYFPTGELLLFSTDFCSLIWIDNGNMVTYKKVDIRDLYLQHIISNTKSENKWQLDVIGDLPEYPKITLRFGEEEQEFAKRLKSILKPREA